LNNLDTSTVKEVDIYGTVFNITKSPSLLWLQYRINHRILATNYLLKKMNIFRRDEMCTSYNKQTETLTHLWNCRVSQLFWNQLETYVIENVNAHLEPFTVSDIIFCNPKFDIVLNKIILLGKNYLYKCRLNLQIPSLLGFKPQITTLYKIERFNALTNFQIRIFEVTWEKYTILT